MKSKRNGISTKNKWGSEKHLCGQGFSGPVVKSHGLTFCGFCGKEKR